MIKKKIIYEILAPDLLMKQNAPQAGFFE